MSRAAQAMTAVLRKDFLQLWPLVAATVVLLLLRNVLLAGPVDPNSGMGVLVQASSAIACCVLLVAIIQQDALVSEQHDWLTRPIPRISLFGAKAIFVLAAIAVPADLSALVAALISGRSVAESVVMGSAFTVLWVAPLLMLAAISTMTRSLLQAAGMLLGIAVVLTATEPLIARLDGAGEEVFAGGSAWIPLWMYLSLLILASAVVIYLQYTRRNLRASRAIVVAAFVLALCGLGYCTAKVVPSKQSTEITCLKRGSQPTYLTANFAGEPAYNAWPSNFPDYTPAFLELLSVRERKLQLPLSRNSTAPSITITAFEPRAHLSREFALPGVLGGAQCTL